MKNVLRKWRFIPLICLVGLMVIGTTGCQSQKKLALKKRAEQIEMAKKKLQALLDDKTISLDDLVKGLDQVVAMNLGDPEVDRLIQAVNLKVQNMKMKRENQMMIDNVKERLRDMLANKDNKSADALESELNDIKTMGFEDTGITDLIRQVEAKIKSMRKVDQKEDIKINLNNYFQKITETAKAGNLETTNAKITEVLKYFASPDVPVLIIIARDGSNVDYDKPTTIEKYLNYLKDKKASLNTVETIKQDEDGKITELELIKK